MSDQDDEFRRQAEDPREMAKKAISEDDRNAWLRIAYGWLNLIKRPRRDELNEDKK